MMPCILAGRNSARNVIQAKSFSDPPGDVVVGAGCVTANAQAADEATVIKGEVATKHVIELTTAVAESAEELA